MASKKRAEENPPEQPETASGDVPAASEQPATENPPEQPETQRELAPSPKKKSNRFSTESVVRARVWPHGALILNGSEYAAGQLVDVPRAQLEELVKLGVVGDPDGE